MTKNLNVKIETQIIDEFDKKIKEVNKDPFKQRVTKTNLIKRLIIEWVRKK